MTQRNVLQYTLDVQRELNGQGNALEIQQAIQEAIRTINSKAAWEFLLASHNISFFRLKQTGTVAGTYGSTIIAGTSTLWDTTQPGGYWSFQAAVRQLPFTVKSFDSPSQITLADPFGNPRLEVGDVTTFAGQKYALWRDRFALPADCDPGRDLVLKGPLGTGVDGTGDIRKRVRISHERRKTEFLLASMPIWYTDDGMDETLNVPTIRIFPPPTFDMEVRLLYYRRMTLPTSQAATIPIPEVFERLIITMAAALLMKRKGMKGWMQEAAEAGQMMNDMYSLYAASPAYVDELEVDDGGGTAPRSSFGYSGSLYTFD